MIFNSQYLGRFSLLILFVNLFFPFAIRGSSGEENKKVEVSSILIEGNKLLTTSQILGRFHTRPGRPFHPHVLEQDIEGLLCFYENNGYPFCKIKPGDFRLRKGKLSLALRIEEGPLVMVDSIRVVGNEVTRPEVLVRELRLRLPLVYCQRAIEKAWTRVRRLEFLSKVYPPEVYYDKKRKTGVLLLRVRERKANTANGVIGYEPKTSQKKGKLTGLLELSFRNILGTGRKMEAKWSRRGDFSELQLSYEEPWVLNLPVNLGGSFTQRQQPHYSQMELALFGKLPVTGRVSGEMNLGWKRVTPDSVGSFSMPESNSLFGEGSVKYDTRNSLVNPTQGLFCSGGIRLTHRSNAATENFIPAQKRAYSVLYHVALEDYQTIAKGQVVALRGQAAWIKSTERFIPVDEKIPLGGTHSLRGYRERQFLGYRVEWLSLEYRILTGKYSRIFAFLDTGGYSDKTREKGNFNAIKVGYGVGIRAKSTLGIVGIDYGLGEGDSILEGKIHFGITGQF